MLPNLIAIRNIATLDRRIPVMLSRNESGSVAGRVLLADGDAPILDGPDIDTVLKMIQTQLEWLLLARSRRSE